MPRWPTTDWGRVFEQVLATVLGGLVLAGLMWAIRFLGATRWAWYAGGALAFLLLYAFLWARYAAIRVYATPAITLALGVFVGLFWSQGFLPRQPGADVRLSGLARAGGFWADTLTATSIDGRKWREVESDPPGMVGATEDGLTVSWPGRQRFERSGFLWARLELDVDDYRVEFEARAGRFGAAWDPGVNLVTDAGPFGTVCAGLRFVPRPYRGCDADSLCFVVGDGIAARFPAETDRWHRAAIDVRADMACVTVDGVASRWAPMPRRPTALVVGAAPAFRSIGGSAAQYTIRNLTVSPGRPSRGE